MKELYNITYEWIYKDHVSSDINIVDNINKQNIEKQIKAGLKSGSFTRQYKNSENKIRIYWNL